MKTGTKWLLRILGAVALIFLLYQGYLHVYYRMYGGYKQFIDYGSGSFYEEGRPFSALQGNNVPGMVLAHDNGILELYTDLETSNVAVYDKRTGHIAYVCPPDADDDTVASNLNKAQLKSPLAIDYFNARRTPGRYSAYEFAIQYDDQVKAESLANGLRYIYTLGDLTITTGIVPLYIHRDRLNKFLGNVENERERQTVEMAFEESADAPDGFMELRAASQGFSSIQRLTGILEAAGYTEEDWLEDSLASGMEGAIKISFDIPLEYRLDGDSLVISVPTAQIVERGGAKIDKISVARFFGAGGDDEDGYMFVPNGSGSLIQFNNGKTVSDEYMQFVYGMDYMTNPEIRTLGNAEKVRMPVFGIYKEGGPTIFAQIGEGQTIAAVSASVAGRVTSYNNVYTYFTVRGSGILYMYGSTGNEGGMPVVEADIHEANLSVRYSFLEKDYEGYSGMARYYREQLEREGTLGDRLAQGDIPLYVDMVGAVTGTKFILSVQYQGSVPMTTYAQASEIVDLFNSAGITNQVVNYQGWFNRGFFHDAPNRINLIKKLGGKKDLEALSAKLEEQGGKLYADVIFQYIPYESRRYNWTMENSRHYTTGRPGWWAQHTCPCCYGYYSLGYDEKWNSLVSPKFINRYVDAFAKRIDSYDVTGISLRDLGDALHSDRKRNELINREQALSVVTAQLDSLAGLGKDMMVSGGNVYALPVASDLINVPLDHSDFFIVDENIPFYQMVVHGYIPYTGYALNRSDRVSPDVAALKLLEYGASPHYSLTYEEASEMKYTGLNHFYGAYYQNWTDAAIDLYQTVNPVLSRVSGSVIVRHEITPSGLRCVTYDNGIQILVNYTDTALTYEGAAVAARGFAVREGVAA